MANNGHLNWKDWVEIKSKDSRLGPMASAAEEATWARNLGTTVPDLVDDAPTLAVSDHGSPTKRQI